MGDSPQLYRKRSVKDLSFQFEAKIAEQTEKPKPPPKPKKSIGTDLTTTQATPVTTERHVNPGYLESAPAPTKPAKAYVHTAIDFGTTFTGVAFALTDERSTDPSKIYTNNWQNVSQSLINAKMPTALLLNPDKTFNSFGYQAREIYNDLIADGKHKEYYFFWNFKMVLHNKTEISESLQLSDVSNKTVEALTVFSFSIAFLKSNIERNLNDRGFPVKAEEIDWVITVPAIWNESSKKFMRLAAQKAGIPNTQLEIALEPEAAAVFCKQLKMRAEPCVAAATFDVGTRYVVADCGGGTLDMTAHEVLPDNRLREIHIAMGSDHGGNKVNDKFLEFLAAVLGKDVFDRFCNSHREDFFSVLNAFEEKKRKVAEEIPSGTKGTITLNIPIKLAKQMKKKIPEKTWIEFNEFGQYLLNSDKLRLCRNLMMSFFTDVMESITQHIRKVVEEIPEKIDHLLVVGGFADSPLLRKRLKDEFAGTMPVSFPIESSLSVLKGAVLYRYDPAIVVERISRYTFGVATMVGFKKGHDEKRSLIVDGKKLCDRVFDVHVKVGQAVKYGVYQAERTYYPVSATDAVYQVELIRSTATDPKYIDEDGCEVVGYFIAERPFPKGKSITDEAVKVKLAFGDTDVKVIVESKDGSIQTPDFVMI